MTASTVEDVRAIGGWTYSSDEEVWRQAEGFATREEAVAAGSGEVEPGESFWTGLIVPIAEEDIAGAIQVDVLDAVDSYLYDNLGPEVDVELDATTAQITELEEEFYAIALAWVKRHELTPKCWRIEHVQRHDASAKHEAAREAFEGACDEQCAERRDEAGR